MITRIGRWLGLGVAVIAAMSLGQVITEALPTDALAEDPFEVRAEVGDQVALEYAEVEATRVQGAKFVNSAGDAVFPGGIWVIVDLRLLAKREDTRFAGVDLIDALGRVNQPETRADCSGAPLAPTGVLAQPRLCFDVSPKHLAGSHLRVARGALFVDSIGQQARDHVAIIDLGLSKADVAAMQALSTGVNSSSDIFTDPSTKAVTLEAPDPAAEADQ